MMTLTGYTPAISQQASLRAWRPRAGPSPCQKWLLLIGLGLVRFWLRVYCFMKTAANISQMPWFYPALASIRYDAHRVL